MQKGAAQRPLSLFEADDKRKTHLQPSPQNSEDAAQMHGHHSFLLLDESAMPCGILGLA